MGQFDWNLVTAIPYHINHPNSPYVQRGWTWSAISSPQRWLQEKFPAMHAYSLHFNGGYLAPSY